jgi:hypothetical protein
MSSFENILVGEPVPNGIVFALQGTTNKCHHLLWINP